MGNIKSKIGFGAVVIIGLFILGIVWGVGGGLIGKNDDQNYQIKQSVFGNVTVQDKPGYYGKFFASIWTYPRMQEAYFSADVSGKEGSTEDESIRVTFNDGGTAQISTFIAYKLPMEEAARKELHRRFSGNPEGIKGAVRSALINVCKNTAPLMSASENQSARKAEFARLIEEQMRNGVYEMKRIEKTFQDKTDEDGKPVTIYVTEIVRDEAGKPKVAQASPLNEYDITILQFSVTGTDYDQQTRKQFEAKKDAFLKAELAKSQKEEEVQKRLQVIEKGLREKAEMEAKMNVERTEAIIKAEKQKEMAEIEAQKKVEVEQQAKLEAEVKLAKDLAVAEMTKKIAETEASQKLEVAKIEMEEAEAKAKAMIKLAEAKQKQIELSGAITEQEQVRLEIMKDTKIGVARETANMLRGLILPKYVNVGGSDSSNGNPMGYLMQMWMMNAVEKQEVNSVPTVK